jgi:hypothetical protein
MGIPEKAFASTSRNLHPDSNVNEECDLQSAKHFSFKTSTDAGIMILINPAPLQFVTILTVIQM